MSKFWDRLSTFAKDQAERVAWTLVEAGAAFGTTEVAGLKSEWAVPLAGIFAYVKTLAAKHLGNTGTASTAV